MCSDTLKSLAGCLFALFFAVPYFGELASAQTASANASELVYIGTGDKGFYAFRFDVATGNTEPLGLMGADIDRPTSLAVDPGRKFLYVTSELGNDGKAEGAVYSYKLDRSTGSLHFLNKAMAGGGGTTFIAVDRSGKVLLGDNYGNGQLVAFQLNADGSIGTRTALIQHSASNSTRQAHPHEVVVAADNRHVLVPDVGLDRVYTYILDPGRGTLMPGKTPFISLPEKLGPRHLVFDPRERYVYLLDEFQASITQFSYRKSTGELKQLQTVSLLPEGFAGTKSATDISISPSGRFLYAVSRSQNDGGVLVYAVDPKQGTLSLLQRAPSEGTSPHAFTIDPTGRFLFVVNQQSEGVAIFKIDQTSGRVSYTGKSLSLPSPNSVLIIPQ